MTELRCLITAQDAGPRSFPAIFAAWKKWLLRRGKLFLGSPLKKSPHASVRYRQQAEACPAQGCGKGSRYRILRVRFGGCEPDRLVSVTLESSEEKAAGILALRLA